MDRDGATGNVERTASATSNSLLVAFLSLKAPPRRCTLPRHSPRTHPNSYQVPLIEFSARLCPGIGDKRITSDEDEREREREGAGRGRGRVEGRKWREKVKRESKEQQGGSLSPDGTSIILFPVKTRFASSVCLLLPSLQPAPLSLSILVEVFILLPSHCFLFLLLLRAFISYLRSQGATSSRSSTKTRLPDISACPRANTKILQIGRLAVRGFV